MQPYNGFNNEINEPLAYLNDMPVEVIHITDEEPVVIPEPTVIPTEIAPAAVEGDSTSEIELHPKVEEPKEEKKIKGPNSHLSDESFQQLIDWVESATKADDIPNEARLYLLEWLPSLMKEMDARKEPMSEGITARDVAVAGTVALAGGMVGHQYGDAIKNNVKNTASIIQNLGSDDHKKETANKVLEACVFLSKINNRWPKDGQLVTTPESLYEKDVDFKNLVNDMNERIAAQSISNSTDAVLTAVKIRMSYDPRTKALIYQLWNRTKPVTSA